MRNEFLLLLMMAATACQPEIPDVAGYDPYIWKRDKFGCGKERISMVDTLLAQRDKLMQLDEKQIIRLLGQPDARDLYVRNQKFLIYLIEPNKRCTATEVAPVEAKALHIRLNALGKSNEMYISEF